MNYAEAMFEALYEAMGEDPSISVVGGAMFGLGPQRSLTNRLREDYGDRFYDPPVSEGACVSIGIGAAMAGERPVIAIGTASFFFEAWSQAVNEAANAHYMSGGQISVPVIFHMLHGIRGGGGAQHSHSIHGMLWNAPGIQIVMPASPADAQGLMRSALKSGNPTAFIDHGKLLGIEGEVPDGAHTVPFGKADIKRVGKDVTVVAISYQVRETLEAAELLAGDGIDIEIVDPRTLVPLDRDAILQSVAKTGRLVVVDEANISCGAASEIAAIVAEEGFDLLKAPIRRVARPDIPVPFSPSLEPEVTPNAAKIRDAVRLVMG
ncbi:MAG: transketolase C-terminal domain-containing protein, partial [Rhodospirillales bacterium]|nr:transketolase C-terminal domain-containing protein [Rhodospirillales bacterium]